MIHQPSYFPLLHYWNRFKWADVVVLLDDVLYSKNWTINRTKITDDNKEERWLTIPVKRKSILQKKISEVEISQEFIDDHKNKMNNWFRNGRNEEGHEFIDDCLNSLNGHKFVLHIDSLIMHRIAYKFGIDKTVYYASEIAEDEDKVKRLIRIIKHFGGTEFMTGEESMNYLKWKIDDFKKNGIKILIQDWKPKEKNYSIIDVLVREGIDAAKRSF